MQVAALASNVSTQNTGSTTGFRMEANAFAFRTLADGLYSNKIGSIVREVSCNALDSHAEAGYPERPIVIHLPDTFEPTFEVQDTGIGLDDAGVRSTFCTLFGSTKRNSNLSVGAFGLGSKTPFSYTDAFQIRAVKDGKVRLYSAYINAAGCPDVTNLGGEFSREYTLFEGTADECVVLDQWNVTDAPNGVTIILPVTKQDDFNRFRNEVRNQLAFFPVKPTILNYENGIAWQDFSGDAYMDFDRIMVGNASNAAAMRGVWVLQGPVGYKADVSHLKEHLSPENREFLDIVGDSALLKFNIGDLEVTPSREALAYSAKTLAAIEALLDTARVAMKDKVQAMIADKGDQWETALYLNGNNTIRRLARLTGVNWEAPHYYYTTAGWHLDLASIANVHGMKTGEENPEAKTNPELDPSQVSLSYSTPWNGVADEDEEETEGEDEKEEEEEEEDTNSRLHYSWRLPVRFRAYTYERKGGRRSRKWLWKGGDVGRSAKVATSLVVCVVDTDEKAERRRRMFLESLASRGGSSLQVFVLSQASGSALTADEIAEVQSRIGQSFTMHMLSDVELPEPKKRGSGSYDRTGYKVPTGYVYPSYGDIYNSSQWQRSQDKLKTLQDGAYYVIVERHRTNVSGSDCIVFELDRAGLLDRPIIGIRQKDADKLAGNPDWIPVRDKAKAFVDSVRDNKTLHNAFLLSRCDMPEFDVTDPEVFAKLRELADAGSLPKSSPLHKLFRLVRVIDRAKARGSRCLTSFTQQALQWTGITFDETPMEKAIAQRAAVLAKEVADAYPLLTFFRSNRWNNWQDAAGAFPHIAKYVHSCHAGA